MTDAITLPSGVEVDQGKVLVIPGYGGLMPVGDLTPAEVQALRDDVAALMGIGVGDLSDTDLSALQDGYILQWDALNNVFIASPNTGLAVWQGDEGGSKAVVVSDVTSFIFSQEYGVEVVASADPHVAYPRVMYGSSGVANRAARSDHRHPPTLKRRYTFDKSAAVLSAGTNMLVNQTVTGLVPTVEYDVSLTGKIEVVNTNSSGRVALKTKIGSFPDEFTSRGVSGGVWTEITTDSSQMNVHGITNLQLQLWIEYQSGDPTALYTGSLTYDISPRGGQP